MDGYLVFTCRHNCDGDAIDEIVEQFGDAVKTFCPVVIEKRKPKSRRSRQEIDVEVPRFRGYLFVMFDDGVEWQRIYNNRFVWGVLSHDGRPYVVPAAVIESYDERIDAEDLVQPFTKGDEIIFTNGPLSGRVGVYIDSQTIEFEVFGQKSRINAPSSSYK